MVILPSSFDRALKPHALKFDNRISLRSLKILKRLAKSVNDYRVTVTPGARPDFC